jgi:hypothetical protein
MGNETSSLELCGKKFSEVYLRQFASKLIHPAQLLSGVLLCTALRWRVGAKLSRRIPLSGVKL